MCFEYCIPKTTLSYKRYKVPIISKGINIWQHQSAALTKPESMTILFSVFSPEIFLRLHENFRYICNILKLLYDHNTNVYK